LRNQITQLQVDLKKPLTLSYPLNSNPDLSIQMTWEEWMQIIYMLFGAIHYGCYIIDSTTLLDCSKHPEGDISQAFAQWIEPLRAGKPDW
jgi:hypothetical protein